MARIEDYIVHCWDGRKTLWLIGLCGRSEDETNLVVGHGEFHSRAGGVCRDCASSKEWQKIQADLERKP